jgi:hypothetical protein
MVIYFENITTYVKPWLAKELNGIQVLTLNVVVAYEFSFR